MRSSQLRSWFLSVTCNSLVFLGVLALGTSQLHAQVPHVGDNARKTYQALQGHPVYAHQDQYADCDTSFTNIQLFGVTGVLLLSAKPHSTFYLVNWYREGTIELPIFHSMIDSLQKIYPGGARSDSSRQQKKGKVRRSLMINPDGLNYFEQNDAVLNGKE